MIPVSARWAGALAVNHWPVMKAELWRTNTRLISDLRLSGGSVRKDGGTVPRTSATLTVADTSASTAQLCTPFGYHVKLYRGVDYPDNTREMPLIADVDIVKSRFSRPAGELQLDLSDPSEIIGGESLLARPLGGPSVTVVEAIGYLIARATFHGSHLLTDQTTAAQKNVMMPRGYTVDGNPWDAIEQLADSIGAECYFDQDRRPVLRPVPGLKSTPDASLYALGGGTVTVIDSELARSANVVRMRGAPEEATGRIIIGYAYDTLTTSPTYVNGPYGRVVLDQDRPAPFATQAAANQAAAAMLARVQGKTRTVTLRCVPNPAIEPGDTVAIRFAGGRVEKHIVQSVDIPIGAEEMTVTTKTTAYTTTGWP